MAWKWECKLIQTNKNQMEQNDKRKNVSMAAAFLFVGCMFLGMAAGWYLHNMKLGLFGGMGIGFILSAVVYLSQASKR